MRDPRTREFGHIEPEHMDAGKQSQDLLAVSASMRTALLVYSGITVKMMVDSDLGAELTTMFMVQYEPDGVAGAHDHPFEETYLFLEGEAEGTFDGEVYRLGPGDVAFAGVGCVHGFRNVGGGPLRWLETQAPQPPGRHSYRFARDWDYLRGELTQGTNETEDVMAGSVVVIGGTSGLGREVAAHYAAAGRDVVLTGRDADRAAAVAAEIGAGVRGSPLDLARPESIAAGAGRRRAGRPPGAGRDRARPQHRRRLRPGRRAGAW